MTEDFLSLRFDEGKYKIAYAASRGPVVELEEDKRKTFIGTFRSFQNISIHKKSFGSILIVSIIKNNLVC